jgi:hypothetical protein
VSDDHAGCGLVVFGVTILAVLLAVVTCAVILAVAATFVRGAP